MIEHAQDGTDLCCGSIVGERGMIVQRNDNALELLAPEGNQDASAYNG